MRPVRSGPFNTKGEFAPSTEGSGLRRQAVRGAGVTVFAQVAAFVVQLGAAVILARLLMPSDFGVVTMVTTFSVLLVSCGQIGFPDVVIQRDEMDHFLASNLFWINVSAGALLTIAFAAAGPLFAKFYGDPRVTRVAMGVSLTIFVTSTSVLHLALLKRAMRFTAVSANDIIARAVSVTCSILLAWAGWGYWALVAGAIALPLSTSIGAWILCRWIPSLPRRSDGTGSAVKFARDVFARWSVGYVTQNTDNLLVGWRFGSTSLGFYKKAYDLFVLPFNLLTVYPVAVSTLSRLKNNAEQYKRYFLSGLSILAFVGMALAADFALVGKDLVRLMLGPRWDQAGQIFVFFGPGIGMMLIYSTHGMIHLSLGTTGRYFRWSIIEVTVTLLLFILALGWGPVGIAVAWTASFWLLTIPAFWYAGKPIGLGVMPLVSAVWKFLVASFAAGWVCAAVRGAIAPAPATSALAAFYRVIATSVLFTAVYLVGVTILHGGFEPLHAFGRVMREMVPWQQFSKAGSSDTADYPTEITPVLISTPAGKTTTLIGK